MIAMAFDMDDTLFREIDFFRSCVNSIAEGLSDKFGVSADEMFEVMQKDVHNPYAQLPEEVRSRFSIEEFLGVYRSHRPRYLNLRPDAIDLLNTLNIPTFVITDGRATTQRAKFEALGLRVHIQPENLIISGETGFDKHTPFPFAIAMERLNSSARWIYIGDNPAKDFVWPNRMGWLTVMLADDGSNIHPQNLAELPTDYHPQHIISNLTELLTICQQLS